MLVIVLLVILLVAGKEDRHLVDIMEKEMDLHLIPISVEHKDK